MTRRRLVALFAAETVLLGVLALALVDRYVHQRDENGVNQWGYRGPARAKKEAGEIRVMLVGGSAAFEAGTTYSDSLASQISFVLQEKWAPRDLYHSVANVSQPRVGAGSYAPAIGRYEFLAPDVVVLFDGYDTLAGLPPHARDRSLVFRASGYLPLVPRRLLGRPEWMSDPDGGIAELLRDDRTAADDVSCAAASRDYCDAMVSAVRTGLALHHIVVVATPPRVSRRHDAQQRSLGEMLQREFGADSRFALVDLAPWIDLGNPRNSPDGIHRTIESDHIAGQRIGLQIVDLMAR